MKKIFVLLALLAPIASRAVVADKFSCDFKLTDNKTGYSVKQTVSPDVIRMPLSQSPAPNVHLTSGDLNSSVTLSLKDRFISAS